MGKVPITTTTTTTTTAAGGSGDADSSNERLKRKKRRKDLEELRRNALAAKRNARNKAIGQQSQRSKSDFMKSLDEFAARRQDIENAVQSQDSLLNRPKLLKTKKLPQPFIAKGFFRAGIKGKCVSRPLSAEDEKLKNAVLHNDALQLMQSGQFCHNMQKQNQSKAPKNIDPQMKMEFEKLFMSSSSGSDVDDPAPTATTNGKVQCSPVIGGIKGLKKKSHLLKVNSDEISENNSFGNRQSPVVQNITKEDRCKRQLFEEENKPVNNRITEFLINKGHDNIDTIRKSTPENIIFYKKYLPKQNLDNASNKQNNYKVNPSEPKLIQFYVETCQLIAEENFKDIFWDSFKDPLDTAKLALKGIYANTFKDYVQRQKNYKVHQEDIENKSNISNSETLVEPDSAIARTLKKHIGFDTKNLTDNVCNNSNMDNLEKGHPVDTIVHNPMKRKLVSSSKSERSDLEIPSSVKVNVDPQTIKIESKMNSIQPERQELIARYLKDVNTNNKHINKRTVFSDERSDLEEINCNNFQNENLFISDISKRTYLLHKSTKHIPAILRKNRPTVNCVAEKEILLRVENYPESNEVTAKISKQELNFDTNLKSECTPDCGNAIPNQLMEAPKCKYTYMNAKYNQPSRIKVQTVQEKRSHRNIVPERHLFVSPNKLEQNFVLTQNFEPSPIRQEINLSQKQYDFHRCHISQGDSEQSVNCMPRMASFENIQERTDRLTLCSQESKDQMHSSQEERCNLHPNFYYPHESSNECMAHNGRPYVTYNKIPSQSIGSTYDHHSHNAINYIDKPFYISNSDFQTKQLENFSSQRSEDLNHCLANNHQMCRKTHSHQLRQEPIMSSVPIQQQNIRQPIKFVAVEANRLPQRRPVYSTSNGDSCLHPHKVSISNQEYAQATKPFTRETLNQLYYPMPPVGYLHQEMSQLSPDFEYENILKSRNAITSNMQAISSCSSQIPSSSRNYVNYVPITVTNPSCIPQQNMSVHTTNNRLYMEHKIQIPILSPLYPQVGYKHNHYNENKGRRMNDVYSQQQMNYNIHSKRQ